VTTRTARRGSVPPYRLYADRAGIEIVEWYDQAVSGANPVASRPGFQAMLERIAGNGVHTIIAETANRFARDLMVQAVGWAVLCSATIWMRNVAAFRSVKRRPVAK
jgi:hypothetical protein